MATLKLKWRSKNPILVSAFVISAFLCLGFWIHWKQPTDYDIDALDRLSFYRDNLPIGSTRLQVLNFVSQHPVRNFGTHELQHPGLGSLQYPLGQVRAPYYCSRQVDYIYFVFSSKASGTHINMPSAEDSLVEINLGAELQDCL